MHTPKGWWQNSGLTWVFYRLYRYNGDYEKVLLNCSANIFHSRRETRLLQSPSLLLLICPDFWLSNLCCWTAAALLRWLKIDHVYIQHLPWKKSRISERSMKVSQNMANMITKFRWSKKNEVMTNPTGIAQETKIIWITRPRLIKLRYFKGLTIAT